MRYVIALTMFLLAVTASAAEIYGREIAPVGTAHSFRADVDHCRFGRVRWFAPGAATMAAIPRLSGDRHPRGQGQLVLWTRLPAGNVAIVRFLVDEGSCNGLRGRIGVVLTPALEAYAYGPPVSSWRRREKPSWSRRRQ